MLSRNFVFISLLITVLIAPCYLQVIFGNHLADRVPSMELYNEKYLWMYKTASGEQGALRPMDIKNHTEKFAADNPGMCPQCKCGVNMVQRTSEGKVSQTYKYSWFGGVFEQNNFLCPVTLINDRFVLTAASCLIGVDVKKLKVVFLDLDMRSGIRGQRVVQKVEVVYTTRGYKHWFSNRDVSLIRLNKPIAFDGGLIRPICLPSPGTVYEQQIANMITWGKFNSRDDPIFGQIYRSNFQIWKGIACDQSESITREMTGLMMCGLPQNDKEHICLNIEGNPLTVLDKKRVVLAGMAAYQNDCSNFDRPIMFATITKYLFMIRELTIDACCCSL